MVLRRRFVRYISNADASSADRTTAIRRSSATRRRNATDEAAFRRSGFGGGKLRRSLSGAPFLPVDAATPILRQVGAAIDCAHAKGVIHGDIKPENTIAAATSDLARSNPESHRVVPVYLGANVADVAPYGLRIKHGIVCDEPENCQLAAEKLSKLVDTLVR